MLSSEEEHDDLVGVFCEDRFYFNGSSISMDLDALATEVQGMLRVARAEALEEAAKGLGWLGAQGNTVEPDTAWAGISACREILERLAKEERGEADE